MRKLIGLLGIQNKSEAQIKREIKVLVERVKNQKENSTNKVIFFPNNPPQRRKRSGKRGPVERILEQAEQEHLAQFKKKK